MRFEELIWGALVVLAGALSACSGSNANADPGLPTTSASQQTHARYAEKTSLDHTMLNTAMKRTTDVGIQKVTTATLKTADTSIPVRANAMALDTVEVMVVMQQTSETSAPLVVNDGAVTFTDTSETAEPIAVSQ